MKKKTVIISVAVILILPYFLLAAGFAFGIIRSLDFSDKDHFVRSFRDVAERRDRTMEIEKYAGCQPRTMMEEKTDEQFSKSWEMDTKMYNFDYEDVIHRMEEKCPLRTIEEIVDGHRSYNEATDYRYFDQVENEKSIEKEMKISEYKYKFLNREFSVLKNE